MTLAGSVATAGEEVCFGVLEQPARATASGSNAIALAVTAATARDRLRGLVGSLVKVRDPPLGRPAILDGGPGRDGMKGWIEECEGVG